MNKISKVTLATLAGVSATSVVATPVFAEETEDAQKQAEQAVENHNKTVETVTKEAEFAQSNYNSATEEKNSAEVGAENARKASEAQQDVVTEKEELDNQAKAYDRNKASEDIKNMETGVTETEKTVTEKTGVSETAKTELDGATEKQAQAQTEVDAATATANEKKADLDSATSDKTAKEDAKNTADKNLADKNAELTNAEQEKNTLTADGAKEKLQAQFNEVKKQISEKETDVTNKEQNVSDKQKSVDTINGQIATEETKKNELETAKNNAEEKNTSAQEAKKNAEEAKKNAETAVETAKKASTDKKSEIDVQKSKIVELEKKVKDAEDGTLVNNLENTANEKKTAVENADKAIKSGYTTVIENGTNERAKKVIADHKNDNHMNLEDATNRNSRANLDNAIDGVKNIIAVNKLRAEHGLQPLKVSEYLMAVGMAQSAKTESIWDANPNANPHSRLYNVGENLAFGTKGIDSTLRALYEEEKFAFDNKSMSDEEYAVAFKNKFGYNPIDRQTGHYENIVSDSYQTMGSLQDIAGTQ